MDKQKILFENLQEKGFIEKGYCTEKCPMGARCRSNKKMIEKNDQISFWELCAPQIIKHLKNNQKIDNEEENSLYKKVTELIQEKEYKKPLWKEKYDFYQEDMDQKIRQALYERKNSEISYYFSKRMMADYNFITFEDTEEIYYYDNGIYSENAGKLIENELEKYFGTKASTHLANETLAHIKRTTYFNRKAFDENPEEICLENGIYNLKTGEFNEFTSEKYFLAKLPIKYKANAECPNIDKFLIEIVKPEEVQLIYEIIGYCLYRDYPIHKAFMFHGEGSNGKSTLNNVILRFLGKGNCSSTALQDFETNQFSKGRLYKKFANIYSDLEAKELKSTAIFKMLTGGDLIETDKKFHESFLFKNYAKMIFSCNKIPRSFDQTTAYYRRWIVIEFSKVFIGSEAKKDLLETLITDEEISGLFNKASKALKELISRGDFCLSPSPKDSERIINELSNSSKAFIDQKIELDDIEFIIKKELYSKYVDWCKFKNIPLQSENTFSKRLLGEYGSLLKSEYKTVGSGRSHCWVGIKLNDVKKDEIAT